MTSKATRAALPAAQSCEGEAELRHYSPEEVHEKKLLPFAPRTLRDRATAGEFPHSIGGGKISFRLKHIREIAAMYDVRPIREIKPVVTAA
ncbi:hypothetical protein FHS39_002513 [Streptomyces olivoverticillatus]|uniref:DNA-binding protein n=1 Tax=Streptomyces olivoverticillatus TaxID=66427 RepID=A0A7W7LP92_9ACTN|nr:hypothetical protein [Streptomyces olivoverticillatus]MBB4893482.1 hypothetical protein [Streptomyces olivoverticillatus]